MCIHTSETAELAYNTVSADRFCEVFRKVLVDDIVISANGGFDSAKPHILHCAQRSPARQHHVKVTG